MLGGGRAGDADGELLSYWQGGHMVQQMKFIRFVIVQLLVFE
jgi:hypothetical protein